MAAALLSPGCHAAQRSDASSPAPGRLVARPQGTPSGTPSKGLTPLGLADATHRDGLLYVPSAYRPDRPASLVISLHGAGGAARGGVRHFQPLADAAYMIVLAPDSRAPTWDFLLGSYAADVAFIDRALAEVFGRYTIDPRRLTIGGFSDGASYALSLGLTNGDLFRNVVAFSPCILAPAAYRGKPRIFISHGTQDEVLPIGQCSRRIVPKLRGEGYEVEYKEFEGPHAVPADVARAAVDWMGRG